MAEVESLMIAEKKDYFIKWIYLLAVESCVLNFFWGGRGEEKKV